MPTQYKVVGRSHRRSSQVPQHVTYPNGTVGTVMQPGPMVTVPVGAILDDVTAGELAAFPDRFQVATGEEVSAWEEQKKTVREQFLPADGEPVDPERVQLQQQIAQLQGQLDAMPTPSDVVKRRLEHAPVDPVTMEQWRREQEALRQVVTEDTQERLVHQGGNPGGASRAPASEPASSESSTTPPAEGEEGTGTRRSSGQTAVGGRRTEERK